MKCSLVFILFSITNACFSQGHFPWENPLKISESTDGIIFHNERIFQDSAGVPCVIRWKGDTLICAFQWFRQPQNSPTWDRVAVKFSFDNGSNWTQPVPIVINNFPVNYQRPFDPTLTVVNDSIRIYYSSSDGMPSGGLDSSINTYSAISIDGIHYTFEQGARYDHPSNRVIDPAVIYFNGQWHYASPSGAPQDGAYHCTSPDGINFQLQGNYASDPMHNWTGNFMIPDSSQLRFYGSGQYIWYNTSSDGTSWQGYVNTNLAGGDPGVIKTGASNYIAVYVGQPYLTGINITEDYFSDVRLFPNPLTEKIFLNSDRNSSFDYKLYTTCGALLNTGFFSKDNPIDLAIFSPGVYLLTLTAQSYTKTFRLCK